MREKLNERISSNRSTLTRIAKPVFYEELALGLVLIFAIDTPCFFFPSPSFLLDSLVGKILLSKSLDLSWNELESQGDLLERIRKTRKILVFWRGDEAVERGAEEALGS